MIFNSRLLQSAALTELFLAQAHAPQTAAGPAQQFIDNINNLSLIAIATILMIVMRVFSKKNFNKAMQTVDNIKVLY